MPVFRLLFDYARGGALHVPGGAVLGQRATSRRSAQVGDESRPNSVLRRGAQSPGRGERLRDRVGGDRHRFAQVAASLACRHCMAIGALRARSSLCVLLADQVERVAQEQLALAQEKRLLLSAAAALGTPERARGKSSAARDILALALRLLLARDLERVRSVQCGLGFEPGDTNVLLLLVRVSLHCPIHAGVAWPNDSQLLPA